MKRTEYNLTQAGMAAKDDRLRLFAEGLDEFTTHELPTDIILARLPKCLRRTPEGEIVVRDKYKKANR